MDESNPECSAISALAFAAANELFSLLFHQVPSVPQGASSLSEGLWIASHFPAVELGHPILDWILGIIGWGGMRRIDREIAGHRTKLVACTRLHFHLGLSPSVKKLGRPGAAVFVDGTM